MQDKQTEDGGKKWKGKCQEQNNVFSPFYFIISESTENRTKFLDKTLVWRLKQLRDLSPFPFV